MWTLAAIAVMPFSACVTLLTPDTQGAPARLTPLQALTRGPRWRAEAMRSYRSGLLLWVTRGQGRITLAGKTSGFGSHNVIWIPPGTMHGMTVGSAVYGTACFLNDPDLSIGFPEHPAHLRVRDATDQAALTVHLDDLHRELGQERTGAETAIACHCGLIAVWLERMAETSAAETVHSAAERLVARYTDMVERQVMTGQGVADYAEALGVTVTHLTRACRNTCGRTAQDLLSDRVTFEARRLLWDTDLPMQQIASMLGFNSAAYFTRAFRARADMTPTAFRESRSKGLPQSAASPAPASSPAPTIGGARFVAARARGWPANLSTSR